MYPQALFKILCILKSVTMKLQCQTSCHKCNLSHPSCTITFGDTFTRLRMTSVTHISLCEQQYAVPGTLLPVDAVASGVSHTKACESERVPKNDCKSTYHSCTTHLSIPALALIVHTFKYNWVHPMYVCVISNILFWTKFNRIWITQPSDNSNKNLRSLDV